MLDGLLPRLEIRLVGLLAALEPGDVLWVRNRLRSRAVLPVANAGRAAITGSSTGREYSRCRRRRHLDNVGQCVGRIVLFGPVAMAASLAVMLLSLLDHSGAKARKGVRVVRRRSGLHVVLLLVPTTRARPGAVGVRMMCLEPRRRGHAQRGIIGRGREDGQLLGRARLERRKVTVVLQVDSRMLHWRRAGAIDMQPVDEMGWVVREDTGTTSEAVARNPIPEPCY